MNDPWEDNVLMEVGNWRLKRMEQYGEPESYVRLYHNHKRKKLEYPTHWGGTMRCSMCQAKPPTALRGLVMIANWER